MKVLKIGGKNLVPGQHTVCWVKGEGGGLGVMDAHHGTEWDYNLVDNAADLVHRGLASVVDGGTDDAPTRKGKR